MLLSEIRDEVKLAVNDPAFTDNMIDAYINDVYLQVVAACLVPELKGIDTVITSLTAAYASLTGVEGGFSGVLSRVYDSSGASIPIYSTLERLMDLNGTMTETGDIKGVALEGTILWYSPIPVTIQTLTVIYYKNPELLTVDSDSPSSIPDFLHRQILVNGAAALMFDVFEDGLDGLKVNTQSREMSKIDGLRKFREWLGKTRKHYIAPQEPA